MHTDVIAGPTHLSCSFHKLGVGRMLQLVFSSMRITEVDQDATVPMNLYFMSRKPVIYEYSDVKDY